MTGWRWSAFSVDGKDGDWGQFIAWDPVAGKAAWRIPEKFMVMSGALATAGDLVFYGTTRWLVQGGRRAHRQGAVAAEAVERRHRPADDLPRSGRYAICRDRQRRRRRGRRAGRARRLSRARLDAYVFSIDGKNPTGQLAATNPTRSPQAQAPGGGR